MRDEMIKAAEDFYRVPFHMISIFSQRAWEASWHASRAALVIELPAYRVLKHSPMPDENGSYNEAIENCRDSIEAAGVKVKS